MARTLSKNMKKTWISLSFILKITILFTSINFLTACDWNENARYIGYVEGELTYMSSVVSGPLYQLLIHRGQEVKKGDILFHLDPEPEQSNVLASQANIANLQAQVDFYSLQLKRQQSLFRGNATSKMELERAQSNYDSYAQQLAQSKAQLIQTQWVLDKKTIKSPFDGRVVETYYLEAENLAALRPVLSLLSPSNIRAVFFLPEEKMSALKIGQKVFINCDGCPQNTKAEISYISPEAQYTPPLIYSKDTRGKLVFLVRANFPEEIAKKFHPGQPISVSEHE
jgi:HlyD family secretion protein